MKTLLLIATALCLSSHSVAIAQTAETTPATKSTNPQAITPEDHLYRQEDKMKAERFQRNADDKVRVKEMKKNKKRPLSPDERARIQYYDEIKDGTTHKATEIK